VSSSDVSSDAPIAEEPPGQQQLPPQRAAVEPLDPQLTTIQPGGGVCMRIELAWGYVRRFLLKTLFPGYVARMAKLRRGSTNCCPWEVLDPRDVKFHRNQPGYWWAAEDDPFTWRDHLPFVRAGLAELFLIGGMFLTLAVVAGWIWIWASVPFVVLTLLVMWFFRNPRRIAPTEPGLVISPADGLVVSCTELPGDSFIQGPVMEIGIFLSVFDVHINRTPVAARVIGMTYFRGKFLNALLPASARENEQLAVRLEENEAPYRRFVVRQIAGAIARRIVCWVAPGEELTRGAAFGMIKFGSRTEILMQQDPDLELLVKPGDRVRAGVTVLARYKNASS
jgi:phosphatidylserine decarboxylase